MTDQEKLIQTRNFVRWMFRKMDNEFDIKRRLKSALPKKTADVIF